MAVNEGPDGGKLSPIHFGFSFVYLGNDEVFLIIDLAKVHPFNRAGVDHRGMLAFVEVLGFVDVSHGDVVQFGVAHQASGKHQVFPQHNGALPAVNRSLNRSMGGEDDGQVWVGVFEPVGDNVVDALLTQKCYDLLFNYENTHLEEIKYFNGDTKGFDDFPLLVEEELDGNLNELSQVNIYHLDKAHGFATDIVEFFRELHSKTNEFYPASLVSDLSKKIGINTDLAKYIIYIAFSYKIIVKKCQGGL